MIKKNHNDILGSSSLLAVSIALDADADSGSGGGAAPAAPAESAPAEPAPTPASTHGEQDSFSDFEKAVDTPPSAENGDDVAPTPPAEDSATEDSGKQQDAPPPEQSDEPNAEAEAARRELAEERRQREAERRDFEARLAKLEGGEPPKSDGDGSTEGKRPDPKDYEFGVADEKYMEDVAAWSADQRFNERMEQQRIRDEVARVETHWKQSVEAAEVRERYADFDEKVTKGADRGDWALSPVGSLMVKESPVGPDIAYHLASNPERSREIAKMSLFEQAREIGRIEGRYLSRGEEKPKAPAKVVSDAPPPPDKRSRGAGGKFSTAADTDDFAAFDKMADGILSGT